MLNSRKIRILHFVTNHPGAGSTQVAIQLVKAACHSEQMESLLALRCKRPPDPHMLAELESANIPVRTILRRSRIACILALDRICREYQPDILVAHGFSEHLWGRYAGLMAGVTHLIQVEHNTHEPYTLWQKMQSRWLARRTARIIGVSEGVRQVLLGMGMPEKRCMAIPNGINLALFADAPSRPLPARIPGIIMAARLHRQKDHPSLLRAIALLRERGLTPPLQLAGSGNPRDRAALEQLSTELKLDGQVHFLGRHHNVPALLMTHRICVLISHYEGFGLALVEGMAAGCAVIASNIIGMREIITHEVDGLLVEPGNPAALADLTL